MNSTIAAAGNNIGPAQRIAGHSKPTTTWDHYWIDDGKDLRPYLQKHSDKYGGKVVEKNGFDTKMFSLC